jgi:Ser/Thr protein kinase RdoA (MazF antagonist)
MNETVLNHAVQCYGLKTAQLESLPGGHFNHVYGFTREGIDYVLRITPPNDEIDLHATEAILDWMSFLSTHAASITRPLLSRNGKLIELIEQDDGFYIVVAFERAEGALAEQLPLDQWSDGLFQNIGRAVGKMHALAGEYVPSAGLVRRPEWDQGGNLFNEKADPSQVLIEEKKERLREHIQTLPKDKVGYGLIHTDLHFGNIYIHTGDNTITIFDFDDCCYGWFVMDIAVSLFDIMVLFPGADKETFAARFLDNYLKGYRIEKPFSTFWINQLPYFLKLLEIGVYTMVYPYYAANDYDEWIGKFMADNRKERIENDIPYTAYPKQASPAINL